MIGAAAAALVVAVVAYGLVVDFADTVLNGAVIDWVASQVLDVHNLNEFGVSAELALDTAGTRFLLFELGLACLGLMAVSAALAAWVAARRREREVLRRVAHDLSRCLVDGADARDAFGEGLEEVALVASEAKAQMDAQERRLTDEAARKNELITYLAHDLKTPLTSVIGYLSLLDEVPDMPAPQRCRYVGITLAKAQRLEALVNEFFDITRYNLTHIELELAPVDVAQLLTQMADEFWPLLKARGAEAKVTVAGTARTAEEPGAPLVVMADAERLARVLNNLLKNALAYSTPGTPIELSARLVGEGAEARVLIEVSDTGVTIPSHKLTAIFDKFFRLDETRATATGGAGLGLAIAREIVTLHGGRIWAASKEGRTTFSVELPVAGPDA